MPELTPEQQELQDRLAAMSPEELKEWQKQQCIFCSIIAGKVPSKKIYEDNLCFGILDINPANKGHILLLTKEHYTIMPQVPEREISHIFMVAKALSNSILKALKVNGTNIIVQNGAAAGQKAQHFMVHIIPRTDGDNVGIAIPQKSISQSDFDQIYSRLKTKVNSIFGIKGSTPPSSPPSSIDQKQDSTQKDLPSKKTPSSNSQSSYDQNRQDLIDEDKLSQEAEKAKKLLEEMGEELIEDNKELEIKKKKIVSFKENKERDVFSDNDDETPIDLDKISKLF